VCVFAVRVCVRPCVFHGFVELTISKRLDCFP